MSLDLRPWGYAPGYYTFTCIDCPPGNAFGLNIADKRAWRCKRHALEAKAIELEFPKPVPEPTRPTMDFNINHSVLVKLNDRGLAELKLQHESLREAVPALDPWTPPKTDDDGFSKFQLWDLMQRLGHLCRLGFEPPFDTKIKIILDQK